MESEQGTIIYFKTKPMYSFVKRVMDIFISILTIVVLSWFFIIIAFLVKITSKGPVFYVSERVGKDGKLFKFYKFRSMHNGADKELENLSAENETNGVTFKMKKDPRVTKFGRFIRKTSIDELPQFFNVLKGDMSIVGPRPALPREFEKYNEYQKQRVLVKQGITCIWQTSGRSNLSFDEQIEMDLEYIQKRGFWKDFAIILKTVPAVLSARGAS